MEEIKHDLSLQPIRKTQPDQNITLSPKRHKSVQRSSLQLPAIKRPSLRVKKLSKNKALRKRSKKLITQRDVIDHIPECRKNYEAKFITEEEREYRKNRGTPVIQPSDFCH